MPPSPTTLFSLLAVLLVAARPQTGRCGSDGSAPVQWKTLPHIKQALGITNVAWDGECLCFSNDQQLLRFYPGRRKTDINGTTVWLNVTPDGSAYNGAWRLAATDLDLLALSVLPKEEAEPKPLHILLDPGHGGEDDGASCKNPVLREKDLTLQLARKIGERLTQAGMRVSYTRSEDKTLALDDRSRIARKSGADLFVSVHANHADNPEASGIETYVLPPSGCPGTAEGSRARGWQIGNRNDYHNTLLGFSIHSRLARKDQVTDRGLKRQSFFVLRETSCPAVLLELGFLSNPPDVRKLLEADWQEQCATAVAEGILSYSRKVDALDRAVADKRRQEAEANERWKSRLAFRTPPPQPPPAAVAACAAPSNSPERVAAPSAPAATNTPSSEIAALLEFYAGGPTDHAHD